MPLFTTSWMSLLICALLNVISTPAFGAAPTNSIHPAITSPSPGILFSDDGTWSNGPMTFSYQWQQANDSAGNQNLMNILGATTNTLPLTIALQKKYIRCEVTATGVGAVAADSGFVYPPSLLTFESSALAFNEGDTAISMTGTITIDVDSLATPSTAIHSAIITVSGNYQQGGDVLNVIIPGSLVSTVTSSFDAPTGILTISGSATVANYQTLLRAVTYQNISHNPGSAQRMISFSIQDVKTYSAVVTRAINVTPINDPPSLSALSATAPTFTEGGAAVPLTTSLTVSDPDNTTLASATIAINSAAFQSGSDVLDLPDTSKASGVTKVYSASTGVLTLTGSSSLANYQAMLLAVTFSNTSQNPLTTDRSVSIIVNDGALNSTAVTQTVHVVPVNSLPVLAALESSTLAFTEGNTPAPLTNNLTISDGDDTNLQSATIVLTANYQNGQDILDIASGALATGVSKTWTTSSGTLLLSGLTTVANYQTMLRAVTFSTGNTPNGNTRTVTMTVQDKQGGNSVVVSRSISVTPVNNPPTVTSIEASSLSYTENANPTQITATLVVGDVDSANLTTASVTITTNYQNGADVLAIPNASLLAGITATWSAGSGSLTLSGPDTPAHYQTMLQAVTYANTSQNPSETPRTISFVVNDGTSNSTPATRQVSVIAVNDKPVLAGIENTDVNYTESDPATIVSSAITVSDVDSVNLASATVTITASYKSSEDTLAISNAYLASGVTATWDSTAGTLTLTGSATLSNYQSMLRSVTYANSSQNPTTTKRTISFVVNDGALNSTAVTRSVAITAVKSAPLLAGLESGPLVFTEPADPTTMTPIAITTGITVNHPDGITTLVSASVTISGVAQAGEDVLSYTTPTDGSPAVAINITGVWDGTNRVMSLVGSDTIAHYALALKAVKYVNTSQAPSTAARTLSITVDDGQTTNHQSNAVTRSITIIPTNSKPVIAGIDDTTPLAYPSTSNATVIVAPAITVTDPDNTTLASVTVVLSTTITGIDPSEDVLDATVPVGSGITKTWTASSHTLALTGSSSLANYQTAARSVTYRDAFNPPTTGSRTISFTANDGALASTSVIRTVLIANAAKPTFTIGNNLTVKHSALPQIRTSWIPTGFSKGVTSTAFTCTVNTTDATLFTTPPRINAAGDLFFTTVNTAATGTATLNVTLFNDEVASDTKTCLLSLTASSETTPTDPGFAVTTATVAGAISGGIATGLTVNGVAGTPPAGGVWSTTATLNNLTPTVLSVKATSSILNPGTITVTIDNAPSTGAGANQ